MTLEEWTREARLRARVAIQPWRRAPKSVGWMVGSGRSGTTWLSSLLNADSTMREVFEPVHVLHVERMKGGSTHYAYAVHPTWDAWLADVFRGQHTTRRTDRDNVGRNPAAAHKLLVKDVFATGLLAAPAAEGVSKLLVMRHPLAVALSKQAHRHWHWLWSTQEFLDQPGWRDGVLSPWVDMLTKVDREGTEMERLVAVWAVIQRISLMSLSAEELPVIHYERAVQDPWGEVVALKRNRGWDGLISASESEVMAAAGRVSFVSKSADTTTLPNPTRWMQSVEVEDRVRAERLLDQLGMAGWHDDRGMPVPEDIQAWREAHAPPRR